MRPPICDDVAGLRAHVRAWRRANQLVAIVPTMGALHAGHLKLVETARSAADRVIVTIFVNPKQFAPHEDFAAYPRDLEADAANVGRVGADLVFAPDVAAMYPAGFATTVDVAGPALVGLEDSVRPTHFAGVATIVAKLLIQADADVAIFGEKDFQQLRVIERLVHDLDLPVAIVGMPIVRDPDGLALSSRNAYLDSDERARAPVLHESLRQCADAIAAGQGLEPSLAAARHMLIDAGFVVDYVSARQCGSLKPFVAGEAGTGRLLAAARLGRTRLIDNVAFVV